MIFATGHLDSVACNESKSSPSTTPCSFALVDRQRELASVLASNLTVHA